MKSTVSALLATVVCAWTSVGVMAHHSLAELYDRESMITVTGAVTQVSWVNPHVIFHLEVEDEAGRVEDWEVEMDPPHWLGRRGWSPETLVIGETVTVTGFRSLDGSPKTEAETVRLPNGESMVASNEGAWSWQPLGDVIEFQVR